MINWRMMIQNLLEDSPARGVFFTRYRWLLVGVMALLSVAIGIGGGWLITEVGVVLVAALVIGMGYFFWSLRDIGIAYLGVIGIVTLLPFGSLPFSIGFTPTFLDLALGGLFFVWVLPYILGEESRFIMTPLGGPILAFAFLAVGTFVAGLSHSALTSYLIRHFAEVLLSIALFYLVVNTLRDVRGLERVMTFLILGASAAAFLGIILYFLPDTLTIRLLSALARFGYPSGSGVLRYIRDDPELMQRATSTSVDPNILGSLLNVTIAMTLPQLFSERPVLPRWCIVALLGVMGLGLGLTISRAAMLGVAVAAAVIALMRYRKLLWLMGFAAALLLVLPWTQSYILHFVEGFQLQDLSTQMRMGEYKDALILIQRYPLLGVGFAGAPDIDIYINAASLYLMVAGQMGLIGLAVFLLIVFLLLVRFWQLRVLAYNLPGIEPLWYGVHAAMIGGLIGGGLDRYFFSLDFHHSVTLFWLLLGLAAAASHLVEMQSSPHKW
ncbi:MAG: O-antigen ligase family protein [Anaerolineae bacterium]|nr:O-antigen ligase family protein [Anaerolineae bacterium]